MKLIDAINNVDKSEENSDNIGAYELRELLQIDAWGDEPDDFVKRVKAYWLTVWYCTDEWVGFRIVFLDDRPALTIYRSCRKDSGEIKFLSQTIADELRAYLTPPEVADVVTDEELAEDIGDHYTVNYGSELLRSCKTGFYNGQPVKVVHVFDEIKNWGFVKVEDEQGVVTKINLNNFHIPFHVVKE